MGSKFSKTNNEETEEQNNKINTFKNNKKYNCETEDISLNRQTKENTDSSSITTTTEYFESSKFQDKDKFVYFTFEWKGEGKNVTLAGEFLNNWKSPLPMIKNKETGIFEKKLFLPRTKLCFKFVIDNNWVCSSQYPTTKDNSNNINNFIDLTNYNPPKTENKKEENKIIDNNNISKNNKNTIEEKKKNTSKKPKKLYNCNYPSINELNTTAPSIIEHYKPNFNINYQSRQDILSNIAKKSNLKYKENNFNTENNTYKKIMVWPHEKLMHLCPNFEDLNENERFFQTCTTIRNKHKYLTLVYYRPK